METILVILVLCTAFLQPPVTSSHLRHFIQKGPPCSSREAPSQCFTPCSRSEALTICEESNSSLVTVYDTEESKVIHSVWESWEEKGTYLWLGLHRRRVDVTTWSDGVPFTFNASASRAPGDRDQICEAIHHDTWTGFNCSEKRPFMCYKSSDYIVVDVEKDWCEARKYCRRHHTDLVSISNLTQNQEVMEKANNRSFWIGLMHDKWKWQDGACSTFREWFYYNIQSENAVLIVDKLYSLDVAMADVMCSKGLVRIKLIRERRTWEEAFEYCKAHHTNLLWIDGPEDQTAVQQWVNAIREKDIADVTGPLWLGLRQSWVFGFWFWTSDLVVNYTNWSYKNDANGPELPWSHQCGAINKNGTWSDVDCLFQLPFFCED